MQDGATISGYRLTGRTRISELGTWNDAISPDGVPSGVLRFDPRAVAAPDARERLVSAVSADRRLVRSGLSSLLPVADLVTARGEVWLITSRRAIPTVADLLAGGEGPDAGSAGTILVEIAQALLSLHAAGLTHGALHPGTVVIAEDGSAMLAERGLMAAVRGDSPPVERDIAAWSALARGLSASWAAGDAARLFDRAAAAASAGGLTAARDTLLAGRDVLPPGFTTRDRLVQTLHRWYAADVPTSPASPVPDPGEIVTLLHADRAGSVRTAPPTPDGDVMMRFGPGVPTEDPDGSGSTAERIWRSGQDQLATLHGQGSRGTPRRGRRRATAWAGTILLAVLIAAGILWLRQSPGLAVAVEKVDVRGPKKALSCDGTATIVGVVTTNGGEGSIRYVWLRSDGQKLAEQELRVLSGSTSVELPLHWKVSGESSGFKGTATLRVLSPTTSGKALQGKASFSYKCQVH
ncbi:hypothetical protein GCM10023194_61020 [Planotetraspora phitsanulokensis]|uniref:Ig-like domain-containing protein n=1 Tax=Planotetraspora phitsanulokensis TaxID=575192 RepID=A0A8J3U629_9ACTN|nr:hypothetical protein [Planotetraspora phitsanulokensis]GII37677.1 hypothetical protein Pph01_26800 [Planotetraspora phitsanulokensis]